MKIIPKLSPQDVIEEVLRMTGLSLEEYCKHVQECGIDYSKSVADQHIVDKVTSERISEAILLQPDFWAFFKNQVYLQSLQFVYDWYHIELSENGKRMNRTVWQNCIKPVRIKAKPQVKIIYTVVRQLIPIRP